MNPEDIHKIHKCEQAIESIKRDLCPILFSFFQGCLDSGFNETQVFCLTNVYMTTFLNKPPTELPLE